MTQYFGGPQGRVVKDKDFICTLNHTIISTLSQVQVGALQICETSCPACS